MRGCDLDCYVRNGSSRAECLSNLGPRNSLFGEKQDLVIGLRKPVNRIMYLGRRKDSLFGPCGFTAM